MPDLSETKLSNMKKQTNVIYNKPPIICNNSDKIKSKYSIDLLNSSVLKWRLT